MARSDRKLVPEILIRESALPLFNNHNLLLSLEDKLLLARLEGKVEVAEIISGEESRQ